MRLWLLSIGVSLGLWAIIRFSQTYRVVVQRPLWGGLGCGALGWAQLSIEGRGYELFRYMRAHQDTLSLARLCKAAFPPLVKVHMTDSPGLDSLCVRVTPHRPSLRVEWILPESHDWVEPWRWISPETLWSCSAPPPHTITLVGKPGLHLYPVVLPREWGVYPETLWIQGHLASFAWVRHQIRPTIVGATGYRVLLSPPALEVFFQVPQRYVHEVSPRDIEVLIDMRKVLPQDTVAYPQVRVRKAYVRNLHFSPKVVRFTKVYGG